MARQKSEVLITQSLLDRLTDSDDWPTTRNTTLAMYRNGIKRDVEWLLNTRRANIDHIDGYKLAANSVMQFGLPDMFQYGGMDHAPEAMAMTMVQTLRTFEPRIKDPRVTVTRTNALERSMRFHVDGILMFENVEEDINFDTVLEVTSGEYAVE